MSKKKYLFDVSFSMYFKKDALGPFFDYCSNNQLNPRGEISLIKKWLDRFNRETLTLDYEDLINFVLKRKERIERLKSEGRHQSIIDFSIFEIYAEDEQSAIRVFDEYVKNKTRNTPFKSQENNQFGSKEYYVKKHGNLDGFRKNWAPNTNNTNYWINLGFSEEEARNKVKERQTTFSLKKCIERYGEKEGRLRFYERQQKWQQTLNAKPESEKIIIQLKKNTFSIEGCMCRGYSEHEARKLVEERLKKTNRYFSQESISFFLTHFEPHGWLFGEHEWFIYDDVNKKHYFYDFTFVDKKVIFEYHGEAFHPNPRVLTEQQINEWTCFANQKTSDEVKDYDSSKKKTAEKAGFKVFEIYSNDTDETKSSIIEQIREAIR